MEGDLAVFAWNAPSTLERYRFAWDAVQELSESNPGGGVVVLQTVLPRAVPPDPAAKAYWIERQKRVGGVLRRYVSIVPGDEMQRIVVRTLLRGRALLNGTSAVSRIVASEREGITAVREAASSQTPRAARIFEMLTASYVAVGVEPPSLAGRAP